MNSAVSQIESISPRVLLLIPSNIEPDTKRETELGHRPQPDFYALQNRLQADIRDYSSITGQGVPLVVRAVAHISRAAALAVLGYALRGDYDIIFSNGENVGIPLACLLRLFGGTGSRPGHVMIAHRPSAPKKRRLLLFANSRIDEVIVYSDFQYSYLERTIGVATDSLHLIPFHADENFFKIRAQESCPPTILPGSSPNTCRLICSAGMEWRDYPTLIEAVRSQNVELRIGAFSPWSRSKNILNRGDIPPNVSIHQYSYSELRDLYESCSLVVVPILQTDFQAGITGIIEAMSMGKPVIITQTIGLPDILQNDRNSILVPAGNVEDMRRAILDLLNNPAKAARLGKQARKDVEESLTLNNWVERIANIVVKMNLAQSKQRIHSATPKMYN